MSVSAVTTAELFAGVPSAPVGAPTIAVVGALWNPGMDEAERRLTIDLNRGAIAAVLAAGGRPELVDTGRADGPSPDAVTGRADGLLFLGGADVDPALYGRAGAQPVHGVDRAADERCLALMERGLAADLPLLAICRGSQLFNVLHGGTLVVDVPDTGLHHGLPGAPLFVDEAVTVAAGSAVADAIGPGRHRVRSGHHQAVDRVGEGLVVAARADDGVVEVTQRPDRTWAVALQWHPEEPLADLDDRRALLAAFLRQAARMVTGEA